jgi:hypothetical protein
MLFPIRASIADTLSFRLSFARDQEKFDQETDVDAPMRSVESEPMFRRQPTADLIATEISEPWIAKADSSSSEAPPSSAPVEVVRDALPLAVRLRTKLASHLFQLQVGQAARDIVNSSLSVAAFSVGFGSITHPSITSLMMADILGARNLSWYVRYLHNRSPTIGRTRHSGPLLQICCRE